MLNLRRGTFGRTDKRQEVCLRNYHRVPSGFPNKGSAEVWRFEQVLSTFGPA